MASIYIPETVNLFATDDGPDNSKHLQISGVTLPKLSEKTQEHHAGGAIGAIEIAGLGIDALTVGFKLAGYDQQTMAQFGLGATGTKPYTVYGVIRDKNGNQPIELKAVAWGRLTSVEASEFKRGDLADQTHEIKEITRYTLYWNKSELYYYDFFASKWRVNGVDQLADINAILRI